MFIDFYEIVKLNKEGREEKITNKEHVRKLRGKFHRAQYCVFLFSPLSLPKLNNGRASV